MSKKRWAMLAWGGAPFNDDKPTHSGPTPETIQQAALKPRWVRAVACAEGEEAVYGPWVRLPE